MTEPLKLLSASVVDRLSNDLQINFDRYQSNGFADLSMQNGWSIETTIARWDPAIAAKLDAANTPEAEINNSLLIYTGMTGMTAALAREERLWARLCHVECLDYARQRWLIKESDLIKKVRLHFFAAGLPACRDDNAIGRLWWNGHIAALAYPEDVEYGLHCLLARANIRMQIIDRADTANRQPLIHEIFHMPDVIDWFATHDKAVAHFMLEVNKRSGGIVFEAMSKEEIRTHLTQCLDFAKARTRHSGEKTF